jgi:heterodisulfide reductase subunit A2
VLHTDSVQTDCLIIGGGISGLTCCQELAKYGLKSVVIDKEPFLGGHAVHLTCKATHECQNCGACLVVESIRNTDASPDVSCFLSARLEHIRFNDEIYESVVFQEPTRINPEICDGCGECLHKCPVPGAIQTPHGNNRPYIRNELCLHGQNLSCSACAEICSRSAINLADSGREIRVKSAALVVAGGFEPFDPSLKPRFGYRRVPGVVTALELEKLMRRDQLQLLGAEPPGPSIAFIQCVGSRDPKIGRNYCSHVCCAYAIRLACALTFKIPSLQVTMFYMDLQNFERGLEHFVDHASEKITFVRAIPAEIRKGEDGRPQVLYHGPSDERLWQSFDLVALSVGISPPERIPALDFLERTLDGFWGNSGMDGITDAPGIFVTGAAQGPKSIKDSIQQAVRTAWRTASYLMKPDRGARS